MSLLIPGTPAPASWSGQISNNVPPLSQTDILGTLNKSDIITLFQNQRTSVDPTVDTSVNQALVDRWNAVAVQVFGPPNEAINLTLYESGFGANQFLPVADPQGTQIGIGNGASFVCAVGQTFLCAKLDLVGKTQASGNGWTVYVRPFNMPAYPPSSALYPSGTTGPIAADNAATSFTIKLNSLQSVENNQIFDAKQVLVAIANIGTGQAVEGATLQFQDTTPGGAGLAIAYAIDLSSIASGSQGYYRIPLNKGVLKDAQVTIDFSVAPTAGQIDVQLYLQGAGGPSSDPTAGLTLVSAPINVATAAVNTIVTAQYSNQIIYVVGYTMIAAGAVNATWWGQTTGTAISGAMPLTANSGASSWTSAPSFVMNTAAGQDLGLKLDGAVQVSGHLTYFTRAA